MARRKRINVSKAIKRPGALSARAKKSGRSTAAQARHDKAHGTPLQKSQGNFYLNVLKPSGSSSGGSSSGGKQKRRSHTVKSHTRTLPSGRTVRVKRHRRSKKRR